MAARERALVNRIADAVVAELKNIGRTADVEWLTRPASVQRGLRANVTNAVKPALLVTVEGEGDDEPGTSLIHRTDAQIVVYGLIEGQTPELAEAAGYDLAADVKWAMANNEQLDGLLSSGHIFWQNTRVNADAGERSALAEVVMRFRANYEWDHDNP